jgi:hypothetical protein
LKENILEIIDHKIFEENKVEGANSSKIYYTMNYNKKILHLLASNSVDAFEEKIENLL